MTLSLREGSNAFWQQLSISRHSTEYTPKQTNSEAAGYFCRERMYGKQDLTNHWLQLHTVLHCQSDSSCGLYHCGTDSGGRS